jgi:Caspase domain
MCIEPSKISSDADLGQILLFYFSGHVIPRQDGEVYLATPQVDPKDPLVEGFPLSELTRLVNSSRARRIICIIDSCYSGAANPDLPSLIAMSPEDGDEKTVESAKSTSINVLNNLLRNEWKYFLLSTQSYSRSYAPKDKNANPHRNSFFTKYVIQGFNGIKPNVDDEGRTIQETGSVDDNGYVAPESLYRYVGDRVRTEVSSQDPVLRSTFSGDTILASYPQLKKVEPPGATASDSLMIEALEYITITDR